MPTVSKTWRVVVGLLFALLVAAVLAWAFPGVAGRLFPALDDSVAPEVTNIRVGFTGPLAANDRTVWVDSPHTTRDGRAVAFARIDTATNAVTFSSAPAENERHIAPGGLFDIDVGPEGLWAVGLGRRMTSGVVELEPTSMRVASVLKLRMGFFDVELGYGAVWVSNAGNSVRRIDPRTGEVTKKIRTPDPPGKGIFTARRLSVGDGYVWVVTGNPRSGGVVTRIDPATNRVVGEEMETGPCPGPAAAAGGSLWVIDSCWNAVVRFDLDNGRPVGLVPVGASPSDLVEAGGSVWVANESSGTVTRIDPISGEVQREAIAVHGRPQHIAAGAGAVWVTPNGDHIVSRIDYDP